MSCPSHQQFEFNRNSNNAILDTGTTVHFGLITTPCTKIHKKIAYLSICQMDPSFNLRTQDYYPYPISPILRA